MAASILALNCASSAAIERSDTFIHTYDVPVKFTEQVLQMPLNRQQHKWTRWYETDQVSAMSLSATLGLEADIPSVILP